MVTTVAEMLAFCQGKNVLNNQFDKYALDGSYVLRDGSFSSSYDDDFFNAGICPAGQQDTIYEPYQNLALRTVEGTDIAIDFETSLGDFSLLYNGSITDKFEQEPSAQFAAMQAAVDNGTLPAYIFHFKGYGDLRNNENIGTDQKDTLKVNYRNGDWGASLSALRVGELLDNGVKSDDGQSICNTFYDNSNVSVYKKFELNGNDARLRFMIRNLLMKELHLLMDSRIGFYSDIHRDEGRHQLI